jgi:hypothetical protein
VEAVGGLGGVALADVVGEDEEVLGDVEGLAGAEEDVGEDGVQEGVTVASGAVEQEDGVVYVALRVAVRLAEGEVVQGQFGEAFAGAELEVLDDVGLLFDGPIGGGWGGAADGSGHGLRVCREGERESGGGDESAYLSRAVHGGTPSPIVFVQSLLNRYLKSGLAAHVVCHCAHKRKARLAAGLFLFS